MAEGSDRVYLTGQERPDELSVQLIVRHFKSPDREIGVVKLVGADIDVRYHRLSFSVGSDSNLPNRSCRKSQIGGECGNEFSESIALCLITQVAEERCLPQSGHAHLAHLTLLR